MENNDNGHRASAGGPKDTRVRGLPGTLPVETVRKPELPAVGRNPVVCPKLVPLSQLYAAEPMPWLALLEDAKRFAEAMLSGDGFNPAASSPLCIALTALLESTVSDDFRRAAKACRAAVNAQKASLPGAHDIFARLDYYAAAAGCRIAAARVAVSAIQLACAQATADGETLDLAIATLGWLSTSTQEPKGPDDRTSRSMAAAAGEQVFDSMARAWRERISEQVKPKRSGGDDIWNLEGVFDAADDTKAQEAPSGVVVLPDIGGRETQEGKRVLEEYRELIGTELPLVALPDVAGIRRTLTEGYPHAAAVINAVCNELSGREHVKLRPIILVGPPGCGKTSFAEDLMVTLGVWYALYPCGGATDAALAGNPRRWATGEPSMPIALMSSCRTASPGIVLDELEKAGVSKQNGSLQDALLGMLEPRTASRWRDPYFQAHVDLSHVLWVATANSLDGVSPALRDRFHVIRFPEPGPAHLPALANRMLRNALRERGVDERWALPLDGTELAALAGAWQGGSLRRLGRLVSGVLAERDRAPGLN